MIPWMFEPWNGYLQCVKCPDKKGDYVDKILFAE